MKHPTTQTPVKDFFLRGFVFGGLGPVILGIVYLVLHFTLDDLTLTGDEVFLGFLSIYLLAFVHAGASVFYQIESWSLGKSVLFHFSLLYVAYVLCYVLNDWLPFDLLSLGIFTAVFAGGYALILLVISVSIRMTVRRLNKQLR